MAIDSASQAPASTQPVVLFDFDGVLFKGDAFVALIRDRCSRQWWRVVLAAPLLFLASPLLLLRKTRGKALRFLIGLALFGVSGSRYARMAKTFGHTLSHDARHFSREALTALSAHRHAGARVVVITGCEEQLARAILDGLGLRDIELCASKLAFGGWFVRSIVHNVGVEKAHQLALRGIKPPWDVAYSDSLIDLPILAAARSAVLVNADRKMLARASSRLKTRLSVVEWS